MIEIAFKNIETWGPDDSMIILNQLQKCGQVLDDVSEEVIDKMYKVLYGSIPEKVEDESSKQQHYLSIETLSKIIKHKRVLKQFKPTEKERDRLQLVTLIKSTDEAQKQLGFDLFDLLLRNGTDVLPTNLIENDAASFAIVQRYSEKSQWSVIKEQQKRIKAFTARIEHLEKTLGGGNQLKKTEENKDAVDQNSVDTGPFETLHDSVEQNDLKNIEESEIRIVER